MSNPPPIFNIPNTKGGNAQKLPNLSIPISNVPGGRSFVSPGNTLKKNKLKRKPPPIDFTKISGSHSSSSDTMNGNAVHLIDSPGFVLDSGSSSSRSNHNENINDGNDKNDKEFRGNQFGVAKGFEEPVDLEVLTPDDWNVIADTNQIVEINKLGEGNGGSVSKCTLKSGSKVFALKLINADPNADIQKQIIRELQYNRLCHSPNIVKYYGTFMVQSQQMIGIAMEYMGGRSLDAIYRRTIEIDPTNRINEKVLGKVAESILKGLNYLHQQKIIHRDIKPSNILLDFEGNIKLCDFGVSGEVVNSLATTFVGTQYYMAPERIMGKPYTVTCDVWSLGLTILEVATCKFPFSTDDQQPLGPIELLSLMLEYEPTLEDIPLEGIYWSESFKSFISYCLRKNSNERPSPRQMLSHPWTIAQLQISVRMDRFVQQLWGPKLD